MSRTVRWAVLFFFFSGITGLVYEVMWTRRLTLTFGHTVLAVSTVLTAYMAGLALGSLVAGRWADRRAESPDATPSTFLAAYGVLEAFIGVWALLSLPLLGLVEKGYLALSTGGLEGMPLHLSAFAGSMLVLIPPTAAMGATLPVMSRLLVHEREAIGRLLSRLYGINTLGAFTGAAAAGFLMLPTLGLVTSLVAAAALNLAIGAAAWWLGQSGRLEPAEKAAPVSEPEDFAPTTTGRLWMVPLAFGLAGVASMAYQVGWTRGLVLSFGSSTYAFSAILTAFLAGLGLGSLLYSPLLGRRTPTLVHLALLQLTAGVLGGATIWVLERFPLLFFDLYPLLKESFWKVLGTQFSLSMLLLIGPTFAMGLMFPLASHLYAKDLRLLGRSVGEVYSANTFGCIIGSFLAGFVAVPLLGAQWTLKAACLVNLAVAVALFVASRKPVGGLAAAAAMTAVILLPQWNPGLMSAGLAVYASRYEGTPREALMREMRPPSFYRDGISCTVSMHVRHPKDVFLRVNGKTDASLGSADLQTMYLTGLLPAILHKQPKTVAVVGLGSGMTLEALAAMPGMERIDCAELEPAVVEASTWWKGYNGDVLSDPRVKMHVTDGRTFILGSPRSYDLIVSEPSNPWIAGIGNLFTKDFYERCEERLSPGGVMAQWVNLYNVSEREIGMVLRSFYEVFPHGMVWQTSFADIVLIGSREPVELDWDRVRHLQETEPALRALLAKIGLNDVARLSGHYLVPRDRAMALFGDAELNTDDLPLLEFSAPLNLYRTGQAEANAALLRRMRESPLPPGTPDTPENRSAAAFGWVNIGNYEPVDAMLNSPAPLPRKSLLLARFAQRVLPAGAEKAYQKALRENPSDAEAAALYGELLLEGRRWTDALAQYRVALANVPPGMESRVRTGAGIALRQAGQPQEAVPLLQQAAQETKESWPLTELGRTFVALQRPQEALQAFTDAAARNPADVDALAGRAEVLLNTGNPAQAAPAFQAAVDVIPDRAEYLVGLGIAEARNGRTDAAARAFREALRLSPDNADAREGLRALGRG